MTLFLGARWGRSDGYAGYDIHIVRGTGGGPVSSQPLDTDLRIAITDGIQAAEPSLKTLRASPPAIPAGFSVTFESQAPTALANNGITINSSTGVVTVSASGAIPNFILTATIVHTNDNLPRPLRIPIRVHVHNTIDELNVRPTPLSLRSDSSGERFTVFATFNDAVVADLSRHTSLLTWQSLATGTVTVNELGVLSAVAQGTASIRVGVAPNLGSAPPVDGVVNVLPAFGSVAPELTLLPGGAGLANVSTAPNYLLVAEGFTASDEDAFKALMRHLNGELKARQSTAPFDLLRPSINLFTLFVASREAAVTVVDELTTAFTDVAELLRPVTLARRPAKEHPGLEVPGDTLPISTVEHLIYKVGMPLVEDLARDFAAQRQIWHDIYGDPYIAGVTEDLHQAWTHLANRGLVGDRDTAFGIRQGEAPRATALSTGESLGFSPYRVSRTTLDNLISQATCRGKKVGPTWSEVDGKDRARVIMICRALRAGGMRTGAGEGPLTAVAAAANQHAIVTAAIFGHVLTGAPPPLPPTFPLSARLTAAHEIAHSLLCGDEYGGGLPLTGDLSAGFGNLQMATALGPSGLDATKIRWRYPRIRAAGSVKGKPTKTGVDITAVLPARHVTHIVGKLKDDVATKKALMQFRVRPLGGAGSPPSPRVFLRPTGPTNAPDTLALQIDSAQSAAFDAWLSALTVPEVNAGLVLFAPLFDAAGTTVVELLHPHIRDRIATSQLPLNRTSGSCAPPPPPPQSLSPPFLVQTPLNLPPNTPNNPFIVGLYDGGGGRHCDVFHPCGVCVMRNEFIKEQLVTTPIGFEVDPKRSLPATFCPVCRYLIVEQLDPSRHAAIDEDYAAVYDSVP